MYIFAPYPSSFYETQGLVVGLISPGDGNIATCQTASFCSLAAIYTDNENVPCWGDEHTQICSTKKKGGCHHLSLADTLKFQAYYEVTVEVTIFSVRHAELSLITLDPLCNYLSPFH